MNVASTTWASSAQRIVWPHVLFSTIYNHYPDAWAKRICPGAAAIRSFWNALANSPQLDNDDIMSRPDFKDRCIPITVHGDGVPVTGIGKSYGGMCDVWSWTSALGSGSTIDVTFYIFQCFTGFPAKPLGMTHIGIVLASCIGACLHVGQDDGRRSMSTGIHMLRSINVMGR